MELPVKFVRCSTPRVGKYFLVNKVPLHFTSAFVALQRALSNFSLVSQTRKKHPSTIAHAFCSF